MSAFYPTLETVTNNNHPLAAGHSVAPLPPTTPPLSSTAAPLVIASSIPSLPSTQQHITQIVHNDRDGGLKYGEALGALENVLKENEQDQDGSKCVQIKRAYEASKNPSERQFLANLLETVRAVDVRYQPKILSVRDRNTALIKYMRAAIDTPFYQQHKKSGHPFCRLVQELAHAKITKVYPYETFKELVSNAALSKNAHALSGLVGLNKATVGSVIRNINHCLEKPADEYRKGWLALTTQKMSVEFGGMYGLRGDPGGESNVPYLRSRFKIGVAGGEREIQFCRFGTPTIQQKGQVWIDPILLGTLDAMERQNKQFLYVNHQKLEGREGVRAAAIAKVEETHANFHFLSIPMDGPIVGSIRAECPIDELKTLIVDSFIDRTNGCALPKSSAISAQDLSLLLNYVQNIWFPGQSHFTRTDLEAFWGIFNTVLKHAVINEFNIDAMNSSCKDNKDRGGTFGSIDEAVRNVLLGVHENSARLQELVFNSLAPFMIKLEHILDNPKDPNHHRLGYLISVLNHIAKLTPPQVDTIREHHARLCFNVVEQQVPQKPKVPE